MPTAQRPDTPADKLVIYVVKGMTNSSNCQQLVLINDPWLTLPVLPAPEAATPTSGANVVKPLMLIESLNIPHIIEIVASPKCDSWFKEINPNRMVPAMEDGSEQRNGRPLSIWESSSCLSYLVDKYDHSGQYGGSDLWERTQVANWMALHTAALGQVQLLQCRD